MKFFPEASLWNRENDFQLQYEYMNWCLKEKHQVDNEPH
jgi:hypothetical protein